MPFLILKAQKPIHNLPKELTTIGDHIRAKRVKSTETQKEVATFIGTNNFTLINWEKNRTKNIPAKYYPKIMEYLTYCPLQKPPTTLAEKIKLHRLHQGFNQKQFAQFLGVSPDSVANWENGKKIYQKTIDELRKVISIEVSIIDVF
jgi:DNA-binding transcriptional regulator YiaG